MERKIILFLLGFMFLSNYLFSQKNLNIVEVRIKNGDHSYKTYKVENNSLTDNSIIKVRAGIWERDDKLFRIMIISKNNVDYDYCYSLSPIEIMAGEIIISKLPESYGRIDNPFDKKSNFIDRDGYFAIKPINYKNSSRYILEIYRCDKKSKGLLTMKFLIDQ